ncbi:MAG: arsenate reductase (glutaredoxin) [Candidimonas sp.]|jgi:arsenate reductase
MSTIYHNPRCSTSRNALQMLQEHGESIDVVDYLKTPLNRAELKKLIADAGLTVRQAMRGKEPVYQELGLDDASLSDEALLDAMAAHPVLLNRPFVTTAKGTRLARPVEVLREIL